MALRFIPLALFLLFAALPAMAETVSLYSETGPQALLDEVAGELEPSEPPESVFEGRRQARRAAERAEAYLNSRAYFAAEISHAVDPGPPIQPKIRIEPGKAFTLGHIVIDVHGNALSPEDRAKLDKIVTLKPGAPALPSAVLAQEAGLIAALKSLGYSDATALERKNLGDRSAATLDVTFRLQPGPRVRFGDVIYQDATRTRTVYLQRLVTFKAGDTFSPSALSAFNRRLGATRLYAMSSARLSETPTSVTAEGEEVRDVIVSLAHRPRYTLGAGASISTSEGPGLTASLTRRNATRRGDTLTGRLTLAAQKRSFEVDWRIPNIVAYGHSLAFNAEVAREETDAFDRNAVTLVGAYEVQHSSSLTYALGGSSEFTRERDSLGQRDLQILSASAAARLDHSDDPLDPVRGWRADLRAEPALVSGDRASTFFTLDGQASFYQPVIGEKLIAAVRARSAFVHGAHIGDLPVSRRFFAGGGGSARGFEYQSIGPKDADGNPIGGRGLLEFSSEMRWRGEGKIGYVAFVEGAAVSSAEAPKLDDLRYSAGVGVRYQTPIGPIRLDLATPLERQDGEDPVQIYLSLGQAF